MGQGIRAVGLYIPFLTETDDFIRLQPRMLSVNYNTY
jgi:hypothetical protein